jgi:hypothetical protein
VQERESLYVYLNVNADMTQETVDRWQADARLIAKMHASLPSLLDAAEEVATLREIADAAREVALFYVSSISAFEWFEREAGLCHKRTGIWPNGKDIVDCGLSREEREAAWAEHLRLRKIELAAALDAALRKGGR